MRRAAGAAQIERDDVRAPGWWQVALEARAPFEFAASLAAWPVLVNAVRGDGHPVVVYPGFVATDASTEPLRLLLRTLGHDAHGWGQGRNLSPNPEVLDRALDHVRSLHQRHGRKVSLVGWSLGGLYARELAKGAPEAVRCVVSLGSPFTGPAQASNAWRLFNVINRNRPKVQRSRASLRATPGVPTTSIYSRSDGVVAWQCSVEQVGSMSENIEVEASHVGMGVNPLVMYALADRLAQPEGQWAPFARTGWRKLAFRDPQRST